MQRSLVENKLYYHFPVAILLCPRIGDFKVADPKVRSLNSHTTSSSSSSDLIHSNPTLAFSHSLVVWPLGQTLLGVCNNRGMEDSSIRKSCGYKVLMLYHIFTFQR